MEGQISIFDYKIVQNNGYNIFHEHCRHRGWHKYDEEIDKAIWMCGLNAHCWADWFPCTEQNCPLLTKREGII